MLIGGFLFGCKDYCPRTLFFTLVPQPLDTPGCIAIAPRNGANQAHTHLFAMIVLYIVQTFKDLAQIRRLVKVMQESDPSGVVIITHNSEAFQLSPNDFPDCSNLYIINRETGSRLDFSLVQAYLDALDYARHQGINFDWVINLTGQCYPARPLRELVNLLEAADVDGFIDHRLIFDDDGKGGGIWPYYEAHNRYHYLYHWRLTRSEPAWLWRQVFGLVRVALHAIQPWLRLDTSYALQIGWLDTSGTVGKDFPLFGGSWYMTLSRRAADYLWKFSQSHPEIKAHFSLMNIPSEVYPHTVLTNNPDLKLSGHQHFFFDVRLSKRGRPLILGMEDLDRIQASGMFFARKFNPNIDSEVLDRLDEQVLGSTTDSMPR